jgi:hypothetical protein
VAGRTQPNGRRPRVLHSSFIPPLALASTSSDTSADPINPRCVEWRGAGLALLACDCDLRVTAGGATAGASAAECGHLDCVCRSAEGFTLAVGLSSGRCLWAVAFEPVSLCITA